MFERVKHVFLCLAVLLFSSKTCTSEPQIPALLLYSPGELEYSDVLVRRVHDNLTLVCEARGDSPARGYVWNYVGNTTGASSFTVSPSGLATSSRLEKVDLQLSDSGHYMCSSPPYSVTKYILVQRRGGPQCARGAFSCGARCVLAAYVCDGRPDCARAEDEAPEFCPPQPCQRSDRLNCTSGRCVPEAACCGAPGPLCRQPSCCAEHARYAGLDVGEDEFEYPPLTEDRHAPDDYGFIQSTIYTVTACALIFMIAVVLLVSALCKMHMKRAALRGYAHAHRDTAHHYSARYPPRYEATRLLDLPSLSPTRQANQCESESAVSSPMCEGTNSVNSGFALSRLGSMFCTRYSQVPTQCDVEMTDVRSTSLNNSPTRNPPLDYRSPIPNSDLYYTNPDLTNLGRDLNYMATPIEFFRRRNLRRNTLDRVIDHLTQTPRPLTLQLGRFQFSIPRFNRREPRPDTPDIAEINIDNLDFVRLNSNDTYTLNGRTIRLLGADFENYPHLDGNRPPPYNEAMRYKIYGPPPEYLSREGINRENEATNNIEMPPCYDDLSGQSNAQINSNIPHNSGYVASNGNITVNNVTHSQDAITESNGNGNQNDTVNGNVIHNAQNNVTNNCYDLQSGNVTNRYDLENLNNNNVTETISSIIDNLPAIDSDFNANDNVYNDTVIAE